MIKTAVIPAAGIGSRLKPLTDITPKCLVQLLGKPLLAYTIDALEEIGIEKVIIVTGYRAGQIDDFIAGYPTSLTLETVYNDKYNTTNNIYSIWLAGQHADESVLLMESDLIVDTPYLKHFLREDQIALDRYDSELHSGTTASVCNRGRLESLHLVKSPEVTTGKYKTVNLYSFSRSSWQLICGEIQKYVDNDNLDVFYEKAICDLLRRNVISLDIVDFSNGWWDEIDTRDDLIRVSKQINERVPELLPHVLMSQA